MTYIFDFARILSWEGFPGEGTHDALAAAAALAQAVSLTTPHTVYSAHPSKELGNLAISFCMCCNSLVGFI